MYLVTTALREFWPESGPIWLLSPGCFPDLDILTEKGRWEIKGIVSDPFKNNQEMNGGYAEICRITEDLLRLLTSRLNSIHSTNHSECYWRTHIGFWALLFVSVVYDRRARLLQARSEIDGIEVMGCLDTTIIPSDTHDFVFKATDDPYNQRLYTVLCKKLKIPISAYRSVTNKPRPPQLFSVGSSIIKNSFRSVWYFSQTLLSSMFAHCADVLMIDSYLPRWFEAALFGVSFGRVFPFYRRNLSTEVFSSAPINEAARVLLSVVPDGYSGVMVHVIEMVGMCIPKAFVETYPQICSYSNKIYKTHRPKAIYSANAWWYDETFKHWAAKCQEQGTILINGTHGGGAFISKYKIFEWLEILISDYYFTWGWTDAAEPKTISVPANKLVGISRRTRPVFEDTILYVCTAEARHNVGRLENFLDYLEWQKRFFKSISQGLIKNFLVRTHYLDYGWRIKDRLLKIAPVLQFDGWEVDFQKRLHDSRVIVFDYLSTTFAEAVASNVPTILFLDETKYPIFETMVPHFRPLKDAHILHDTPESAAAWVAQVYDDTDSWWLNESCQKAVKDFCYLYARTSKTSFSDWKKTFETLVNQ